jgi:hypothetical protein
MLFPCCGMHLQDTTCCSIGDYIIAPCSISASHAARFSTSRSLMDGHMLTDWLSQAFWVFGPFFHPLYGVYGKLQCRSCFKLCLIMTPGILFLVLPTQTLWLACGSTNLNFMLMACLPITMRIWWYESFSQQHGINYDNTISPVVKLATIRIIFSIAASCSWPIH